jgi:hypothetical protein
VGKSSAHWPTLKKLALVTVRDHPAHREPKKVDLFETAGLDESDRVLGHLLDRGRR